MSPTKAMLSAVGQISRRVSRSSGTRSGVMPGRRPVISPSSATFGTEICAMITIAVTTTIAMRGDGTAFVSRGTTKMIASVRANSAYAGHVTFSTCGTWATKIRMPRALTNPSMTERGMNRMRRASPPRPKAIWMTPARTTVGRT